MARIAISHKGAPTLDPSHDRRKRPRSGPWCSVNGCLIAAVTIFIVLLIGLLIIGYFRFSEPPASTEHVVVSNVK